MIKVILSQYTSVNRITIRETVIEDVTVIDMDDGFLRLVTGEGEMLKISLQLVACYTAEVI